MKADVRAGRAWGCLSEELLGVSRYIFSDLLLAPLMEMLKYRGLYGLHAACLTKNGGGYLFPGAAGSGKTTIGLSLVKQGFQYLADDKVLLRDEGNGIAALAFTRRFNINPDIGRHYTELGFLEDLPPLPKSVKRPLDISRVYPNTFVPCCSPKVVVHLERTSDFKSRVLRLSSTESFTRLVHQTVLSLQKETAMRQLRLLGDLVHDTESYLLADKQFTYKSPSWITQAQAYVADQQASEAVMPDATVPMDTHALVVVIDLSGSTTSAPLARQTGLELEYRTAGGNHGEAILLNKSADSYTFGIWLDEGDVDSPYTETSQWELYPRAGQRTSLPGTRGFECRSCFDAEVQGHIVVTAFRVDPTGKIVEPEDPDWDDDSARYGAGAQTWG